MNSAILILTNEYINRKKIEPKYSLRKYSADLGVSPSLLVSILNGRRAITQRTVKVILEKIKLEKFDEVILKSFLSDYEIDPQILEESKVRQICSSYAKYLTDWKYQYISEYLINYPCGLSLDELRSLVGENISRVELFVIMTTLEVAKIVEVKDFKYFSVSKYNVNLDFNDEHLVSFHERFLDDILKNVRFLREKNRTKRLLASLTFTIDENLLESFSNELRTFLIKLGDDYSSRSKSDKVFQLTFQGMFPSDCF